MHFESIIKSILYYAFMVNIRIIAYLNIHIIKIMFTFTPNNIKEIKEEVGALLRKMRKTNSLSQQDLADLLNLSRITIQNVESGKNFTIDVLLLILQHFNELDSFNNYLLQRSEEYENVKSLY